MPKFTLQTDHPIAVDSPDHIHPWGTMRDNSKCRPFCELVEKHFAGRKPLRCLDLGCSGGGLCLDWVEMGHEAVGLEGSDYSLKRKRAEWATIPDRLFTCDCSYPFQVYEDGAPALFDVITGWEFFEHVFEERIPTLLANVRRHLKKDGLVFASIPEHRDPPWHVCLHDRAWWDAAFHAVGFEPSPEGLAIVALHRVREHVETAFSYRLRA
jgi:cyclopropane fatty-acyl-phospholipid synthase-like methyltransferase